MAVPRLAYTRTSRTGSSGPGARDQHLLQEKQPPTIDDRLRALPGPPEVLEVDYPANRKPLTERERSWRPVTDALRGHAHLA